MSTHPNVAVIDRMTQAIVDNDRETLTRIFTDDMVFHGRGPIPFAGDHKGADGLLAALGTVFELTRSVPEARFRHRPKIFAIELNRREGQKRLTRCEQYADRERSATG